MKQWYKIQYGHELTSRYTTHQFASSPTDAAKNFRGWTYLKATPDPTYQQKLFQHHYWYVRWQLAKENMPYFSKGKKSGLPVNGQATALMLCLGYKYFSERTKDGIKIRNSYAGGCLYQNIRRGTRPS